MAVLFTIGVALVSIGSTGAAPNLVTNAGFEDGATGWRLPGGFQVVGSVAHSGTCCLCQTNQDPAVYHIASQKIPFVCGERYRVSAWVKCVGIVPQETEPSICLEWRGAKGWIGGFYPLGKTGDQDWQLISGVSPPIPADATSVQVDLLQPKGTTGSSWYDDVNVSEELTPSEMLPADAFASLDDLAAQCDRDAFSRAQGDPPFITAVTQSMNNINRRIALLTAGSKAGTLTGKAFDAEFDNIRQSCLCVDENANLRCRFERIRADVDAKLPTNAGVVVGFASSMDTVFPRAASQAITVDTHRDIEMARNEWQSFQVVVLPCQSDLSNVSVHVGSLTGPHQATIAAGNFSASPVGYVRTTVEPPYGTSLIGWWPDPILVFLRTADIAQGDKQTFWVRCHMPLDQPAGLYHGQFTVESSGKTLFHFGLNVRVYNFGLPSGSPLPTAINFAPESKALGPDGKYVSVPYTYQGWSRHKADWANMLADYGITFDDIYRLDPPDFGILQMLHRRRQLGLFNLGYFTPCPADPAAMAAWKQTTIERIRPIYNQARTLGLIDHAYIYGADEVEPAAFPDLQRAAVLLKQAFPEVPVITTARDTSYGQLSGVTAVDYWCPLTPKYFGLNAAVARAAGKKIWWYICEHPTPPYANMFVESPAIEGRLLMGAMTAKFKPDGFLYYQVSIWNSNPITKGPFTDWNPNSFAEIDGDGSWTCVGPDGTPLPTIRLENYRDGLEDYAYYLKLQQIVNKYAARSSSLTVEQKRWLANATALLAVPDTLVASMTDYSHNSTDLLAWRNKIGDSIDSSGEPL